MGFFDGFRNLAGTVLDQFQIGIDGPILQRVASTDRLRLPDLLRFLPSGAATEGLVQSDALGNLFVAPGTGGGITAAQHKTLRQLIHFINEGPGDAFATAPYREQSPNPFPTSVVWYESSAKSKKIYELAITRSVEQRPTQVDYILYDTDGATELIRATDTMTYAGAFETSRERIFA